MRILVIGQTSLHWGRMEYGNIGNYYIIEPFFRQLHRVFPDAEIVTTLQMSDDFCRRENVERLPLELYYSWENPDYLEESIYEYGLAGIYEKTGCLVEETPYIREVKVADLVVDFSGDIWSDNADFIGPHRFLIGLLKDRTAQLLGKKTVMLSGSPAPFVNHNHAFTREVFESFDLVTNREKISTRLLKELGYRTAHVKSFACPAFIFEPGDRKEIGRLIEKYSLSGGRIKTGFILCGWNMVKGPFDREDISDAELLDFVELIERHVNELHSDVYLMSHSNGFELPPNFRLKHGRDYPFATQLFKILKHRNEIDTGKIHLIEEILSPRETKAVIGQFDMLISGRIHGAVAGLSQAVPTVIIDYGHEPKAHKLKGFAEIAGVEQYVADPTNKAEMFATAEACFENRESLRRQLKIQMQEITNKVEQSFDVLRNLF